VTLVFFLFLSHLGLGLLATIPFVPERAGRSYFKFCSASAAFTMTAALGLGLRRYGWPTATPGADVPGGSAYSTLVLAAAMSLVFAVLYNRAWHFTWPAIRPFLLAASLAAGLAAVVLGAPPSERLSWVLTDLTSILLLGAAASAMVLGHWYLVVLDLPITALRRLTVLLALALVLRAAVVALALVGPVHAGLADARAVAAGLWSPDGVFVWMRLLFGLAGPFSLLWFIWKTVEIRSTQSATGILYVQLFLVLAGELLAKYLRVAAGFPL
jgi:protein NrfD